jgi:hypothetical protein
MFRLRCTSMVLRCAMGFLPLYVLMFAGCATTAGLTRTEPGELAQTADVVQADLPSVHTIQLSSAAADLVIARAIVEHEMRRP